MRPLKTLAYVVNGEGTLETIAERFGLQSSEVIRRSPRNAGLKSLPSGVQLPEGSVVYIPPHPGHSLKLRLGEINRLVALLRNQFESHYEELESIVAALVADPGVHESAERLQRLHELVGSQIEQVDWACDGLNQANDALHQVGCLTDPDLAGVVWLLSRDVVSLWQTMWSPPNWSGGFAGQEEDEIRQKLIVFFNMVKSRVVQHAEWRARETVLLMQQRQT